MGSMMKVVFSNFVVSVLLLGPVTGTSYSKTRKGLKSFPDNIPNDVTILDLPHNALRTVTSSDLQMFTLLVKLYLNNNQIANISSDAFEGLSLQQLRLSSNPLTSVPNLYPIQSTLTHVYLSYTHITDIDTSLIDVLTSLTTLDLSKTRIKTFPGPLAGTSTITDLNLFSTGLQDAPWDALSGYENLGSLKIHENGAMPLEFIYNLTAGMDKSFPKISTIYLNKNYQLVNITRYLDYFSPFPNTIKLYMDHVNLLEFNPPYGVLSNITLVQMRSQSMTSHPVDILENMTSLTDLDMSYTSIRALLRLTSSPIPLRKFTMVGNTKAPALVNFASDTFANLPFLHTINLVDNTINQQFPNLAPVGSSLRYFYIYNNNLTFLPDDALRYLGNITRLELQNNKISVFPNLTGTEGTLEILYLGGNRLEAVPEDGFPEMAKLHTVTLNRNLLHTFPNITGLRSCLVKLEMEQNSITDIPGDAFDGFTKLGRLDLSKNELTKIPNVAQVKGSLHTLHLDHNKITNIDNTGIAILSVMEKLQELKLNGNDMISFPALTGSLHKLQTLDLQDNKFTAFPEFSCCLKGLKTLEMSGNDIKDITNLAGVSQAESKPNIVLIDNNISYIPPEITSVVTVVTTLQLHGNPLICNCSNFWMKSQTRIKMSDKPCTQPSYLRNTRWTALKESDVCPEEECPPFPSWKSYEYNTTERGVGAYVGLSCPEGYILADKSDTTTVACLASSSWLPPPMGVDCYRANRKKLTYELTEADGAVYLGILGLIFVISEMILLTLLDIVNLCRDLRFAKKNVRDFRRKIRKWRTRRAIQSASGHARDGSGSGEARDKYDVTQEPDPGGDPKDDQQIEEKKSRTEPKVDDSVKSAWN